MPRRKAPARNALQDRSVNTAQEPTMAPNKNGKRAIEVLDLTGSDDEVPSYSQPRKQARSENNPGQFSQAERNEWVDDHRTEAGANELIASTQDDAFGGADETFELYGILATKIVGVQYYNGHATVGEHVLIRREPRNQYDSNAIRVDNVQRLQIGHIPRQIAAKLAPYMDAGELMVNAVLSGQMSQYDCPLAVHLYGTTDPAVQEALKNRMKAERLPTDTLKNKEREAKARRAAELKKVAKKGPAASMNGTSSQRWDYGSSQGEFVGSSSQGLSESAQSLEDIILESERFNPREMGEVVEKFGAGEEALSKMPMADLPERLATSLLPYQRQGLAWLLEKENPQIPPVGSQDIVQLWKRSPTESRVFTNIATNFSIKDKPPTLASGGILADDMGLGKTLEMIALIVADMSTRACAVPKEDKQCGGTLIVAPLSVMSNWSGQVMFLGLF